ncbi:MAG: SocA family protein [Oceanospirillales bacterium]|nr:SocA family protein [Oceanospirillales bacterium]
MANVQDVARCFLYLDAQQEDGEGISNLKLQKLAYYAQGFHLAIFDEPLFDNEIQAWAHGPVVPTLYHAYKESGRNPIHVDLDGFDPSSVFGEDEFELIQEVYEVFGQYSAWTLRNMTHEEAPWLNHEERADTIPVSEMKEYFKKRIE